MNLYKLLFCCTVISQLVLFTGCTASKRMDTLQYTDFDKLDRLREGKIQFKGKSIVVDSLKLRSNSEEPTEYNHYVWTLKTSSGVDPTDMYKPLHKSQKYLVGFQNLPIKDLNAYFRTVLAKHLQASGEKRVNISIDVRKITLSTANVGPEKYRACNITISINCNGKEVETSSELKLSDSYTKFNKGSQAFARSYYFDPEGLDVVELAFVDALQQGLAQLIQ